MKKNNYRAYTIFSTCLSVFLSFAVGFLSILSYGLHEQSVSLIKEQQKLITEIESFVNDLKNLRSEFSISNSSIEKLVNDLNALKKQLDNSENNFNLLKKELKLLQLELENLKIQQKQTISILGDSISTCEGISDNLFYNNTLATSSSRYYANDVAYTSTEATLKLDSWKDTYWGKTIDEVDLELVVNNSIRGSSCSTVRGLNTCTSGTRATQLHNNSGFEPDIIVIYIGTNDYNSNTHVGRYSSVTEIYDGRNYIGDTSTFSIAYATMIHKIKNQYQNANIYCCNLIYGTELGQSYNSAIAQIVNEYDCQLVDFSQLVSSWSWRAHCMDGLHPNKLGFELMANILIEKLK